MHALTILPCPFCGSIRNRIHFHFVTSKESCVLCANCNAQGPTSKTEEKAVERWNSRTIYDIETGEYKIDKTKFPALLLDESADVVEGQFNFYYHVYGAYCECEFSTTVECENKIITDEAYVKLRDSISSKMNDKLGLNSDRKDVIIKSLTYLGRIEE